MEQSSEYLKWLGSLARYGKALFKPLFMELVEEGLKKPQGGEVLGLDGVSVLKGFAPVMIPHMYEYSVYTPFLCAMHAKQNRCRSTQGPISRGKDFPLGPSAGKSKRQVCAVEIKILRGALASSDKLDHVMSWRRH